MDTLKVKEEAAEQSDGSDYADAWDDDKWNDAEVGHKPCAGLTFDFDFSSLKGRSF